MSVCPPRPPSYSVKELVESHVGYPDDDDPLGRDRLDKVLLVRGGGQRRVHPGEDPPDQERRECGREATQAGGHGHDGGGKGR